MDMRNQKPIDMNTIQKSVMTLAAAIILVACGSEPGQQKLPASGSPYDVYTIASHELWYSLLGDTIRSVMAEEVPYLNAYEPQFDLFRVAPNRFNDLIKRSRNLLVVTVGSEYTEPRLVAEYDKWAAPQLVVYAVGPDPESLTAYVHENGDKLREIYNMAERDRTIAFARRTPAKRLAEMVKNKFGIDVDLLQGFILGKETDDFIWMRFRYPEADQELSIYSYPYTGPQDFTLEALLDRRDQFVSEIPGEVPDSHMITYRDITPSLRYLRINGRYWAEMRGFWDVKNDFMGGPFVNFTTVDEATNRVISIDGALFSPSPYKTKRNLLRQLESIVYGVRFPSDKAADQKAADQKVQQPEQPAQTEEINIEEITIH